MTIRETLISMGYREIEEGKWAKPVGYHLFTFEEAKSLWTNWCYGADEKIHIYESHPWLPDSAYHPNHKPREPESTRFIVDLKTWEAYTRISIPGTTTGQFHLSAIDI